MRIMEETIEWRCPACGEMNIDDLDPELGPFLSCTCGSCGKAFDQDSVPGLIRKTRNPAKGD